MIAVPLIVSSLFALASGLQQPASVNRRSFFAAPLVPAAWGLARQPAFAKGPSLAETKSFVKEARDSLDPLPDLLQKESWDTVRTVLKIKCGKLWNLGEAQNPIVQFARDRASRNYLKWPKSSQPTFSSLTSSLVSF